VSGKTASGVPWGRVLCRAIFRAVARRASPI
jgi:hypothetical protein